MDIHIDNCMHAHTHTHIIPAVTPCLLHSSLPSFLLSCFKSCWTVLGFRWFFVVLCTLCYGYDITARPHGALYTYTGDSKTLEVYHKAQQRLRGHLSQSHIQASRAFHVSSLPFYGKTLSIHSHYCGEEWETKRRIFGALNEWWMPPWVGVTSSDWV